METKALKPEYQELADEFDTYYGDKCCTCFIHPPCSYCTHEGNPNNLAEIDEAWEDILISEVRRVINHQP